MGVRQSYALQSIFPGPGTVRGYCNVIIDFISYAVLYIPMTIL